MIYQIYNGLLYLAFASVILLGWYPILLLLTRKFSIGVRLAKLFPSLAITTAILLALIFADTLIRVLLRARSYDHN